MQPEVSATSTIRLKNEALLLKVFNKNSVNTLVKDTNEKLESMI